MAKELGNKTIVMVWSEWHRIRYAALVLCRIQQRLEARLIRHCLSQATTANQVLEVVSQLNEAYHIAQSAESLALTELEKLKDSIPTVEARTPAEVGAKLEIIVGSEHDIEDRSAFPLPQLISALRDLKSIAQHPTFRRDRATTRSDVSQYWNAATRQIAGHNSRLK